MSLPASGHCQVVKPLHMIHHDSMLGTSWNPQHAARRVHVCSISCMPVCLRSGHVDSRVELC